MDTNKNYSTPSDYESKNLSGAESNFQEKIMRQINDLGEVLERAGNSISGKGWETIGNAIHKLGDTLEHLDIKIERKNSGSGAKAHELMSDDSDDVLGKTKGFSSTMNSNVGSSSTKPNDNKSYAGASRTDSFDTTAPSTSSTTTSSSAPTFGSAESVGSVGTMGAGSKTADSLQSKSTKPKASDSQAY